MHQSTFVQLLQQMQFNQRNCTQTRYLHCVCNKNVARSPVSLIVHLKGTQQWPDKDWHLRICWPHRNTEHPEYPLFRWREINSNHVNTSVSKMQITKHFFICPMCIRFTRYSRRVYIKRFWPVKCMNDIKLGLQIKKQMCIHRASKK